MASDYDATDFVDADFSSQKSAAAAHRAPTREEVDARVTEAQQKLTELKRAQEELERERSALEELRRRQMEFQTGRHEMIHNLTRGLGLLEEAEFTARLESEQMARTITDFRDALAKVEAVREDTWSKENFHVELTRALTAIENARMEWNGARLKFPVLTGRLKESEAEEKRAEASPFAGKSFGELCRLGLALTWPLAVIALLALGVFIAALVRR